MAALAAAAVAYAVICRREPRRMPLVAWELGLAVIALATCSPLDSLADTRFSAHMVQHELLTFGAAPLLVVGAQPLTRVLLPRVGRPIARWGHAAGRPGVAWTVATVVLWVWHWPPFYDLALDRPAVHDIEHITLLTAYAFYWSALGPVGYAVAVLRRAPSRVLYLTTGGAQAAVLGALLAFSTTPFYSRYVVVAGGTTPALRDQQLGGTIMLLSGGLVFAAAAVLTIPAE